MNEAKYQMITEEDAKKQIFKNNKKAEKILSDPVKTEEFLKKIENVCEKLPLKLKNLKYVPILGSMINHYMFKQYREIPFKTIISCTSALLYLINPFDLIPDSLPGIGHLDDSVVIGFCVKSIKSDIDKFIKWREENENSNN